MPSDGPYLVSEPALQRLLQNFARDESFYEGTGLVYPAVQATGAGVQVVSRDHARIVEVCRQVDVGKAYQTHLDEVLDARAASALAEDARCAFDLAAQLVRAKHLLPEAEASLSQRDFWQAYLRERHETTFDALIAEYAAQGEQLDQEREQLTSQDYTQRWQDLLDAREAALQALSLELTREALEQDATRLSSTSPAQE